MHRHLFSPNSLYLRVISRKTKTTDETKFGTSMLTSKSLSLRLQILDVQLPTCTSPTLESSDIPDVTWSLGQSSSTPKTRSSLQPSLSQWVARPPGNLEASCSRALPQKVMDTLTDSASVFPLSAHRPGLHQALIIFPLTTVVTEWSFHLHSPSENLLKMQIGTCYSPTQKFFNAQPMLIG